MAIDLDEVEGYHLFIFCLSGKAELNIHRETMDASGTQGVYVAPGTPLRGRFSHDCEQLVLRVDKRALTAANEGNLPHFRTRIDMKAPLSSPWASILNSLIGDDSAIGMVQGDERIARNYERLLLSLLLAGEQDGAPARASIAPAAVRKAEAFMREHFALPMALLQTWGTAARRHPVGGLGSIGEMLIEHNHGFGQGRGSNSECSFNQAHLPHDTWLQAPCLGLSFA